ncbi:MAG: hypothetical protein EZS26_002228 [Candidatus Ordinivivax streblomastigis]|uniref:Cadherin-like beta-sandwich-like domain-containing protein n=1 Tax=Candidatus Ordinivivax streblomastigis TaxID=2540710 RepID=A0A5M8NZP8_9BACT|nr:MAG: hypothetical protein EZS26_002228 [Candidatus Ordinivivax streblomastigis]
MKKLFTSICVALLLATSVFGEETDERILVVKPVNSTRMDTPTDWGGLSATAANDSRFELSKVDGYENLYKCILPLKQYCKTNKWKGAYGEAYNPDSPNEGWSNIHQFVVVYRDAYGDQENKDNPNAIAAAQSFTLESDDVTVTFYAIVQTDGRIRSYCDTQASVFGISNNTAGGITLPPAIGKTSTSGAIYIDGNGKLEITTSAHLLRPDGQTGNNKYAIYDRGRHAFTVDFLSLVYSVTKVPDALRTPKIQIGTQAAVAAPAEETSLGVFTADKPLSFIGSFETASATATVFNVTKVEASLYYQILAESETEGEEVKVPLTTLSQGTQVAATWKSEAINVSEGLADGNYTLKFRYETNTLGDLLVDDNDGEGYTLTFSVYNNLKLNSLTVSEGELTPDFDPEVKVYTVEVGKEIAAIVINAAAEDGLIVNGDTDEQTLDYGSNVFTITVHPDGVEEALVTYTLTVNRAKSTDATLGELSVSEGTLAPEFDPEVLEYTVEVANTVSSIDITAVAADGNAKGITGTGTKTLTGGANVFLIVVTAQDEVTTRTYQITVNKPLSSDASLSALTILPAVVLTPAFDPATLSYTATVGNAVSIVAITATPSDAAATAVTGAGIKPLTVGENTLHIEVTAEDGTTVQTYTLTISRELATAIIQPGAGLKISSDNGQIQATFAGTAQVKLYAVTGQLLNQATANGYYIYPASKGVYILSIHNKSYKLVIN